MRAAFLITVLVAVSACMAPVPPVDTAPDTAFTDGDWNWVAQPNCAPPRPDAVTWQTEEDRHFVRFQLRDGDIGNCPTDNDRAHSAQFGKPYSERVEWKGRAFTDTNATYQISFDVRFVSGFDQDQLSATFMQIKDCPDSDVPVMVKLGGWKKPTGGRAKIAFALGSGGDDRVYHSLFLPNDPVDNMWHRVEATFTTGELHQFSFALDGQTLLSETTFPNRFTCGRPSFRIGIYRSGDLDGNSHSIVDYDRVTITRIQ